MDSTRHSTGINKIRETIRNVPDFPKPGILFKDITPVLKDPELFGLCIEEMLSQFKGKRIDHVVAIESRGFIFGAAIAREISAGLVVVRKPKKLPYKTNRVEYALEYGTDALEMHIDALEAGNRVLVVDDLLATGGTALATAQLVKQTGAILEGFTFLSELEALKGRDRLGAYLVHSVLSF